MKKFLCFFLALALLIPCITGCSKKNDSLLMKGAFLLNPSDEISFVRDISDGKQFLLVVYDINYTGSANQSTGFASANFVVNNENTYEETQNSYVSDFVELSGYNSLQKMEEILGGNTTPLRTISVFEINPNDIKEGNKFTLDLDISKDIKGKLALSYEDIIEISLPDEIFNVEENPQAYQVARSVAARAIAVKKMVTLWTKLVPASSYSGIVISATPYFSSTSKISVASTDIRGYNFSVELNSEKIKPLNIEDVKLFYPEIADEVEGMMNFHKQIHINNDKSSLNDIYIKSNAYIKEILDYFDISEFEFNSYELYK